eukprot:TRINITY_DN33706_c0_g1_i1.p1 TRINITY_DN33706_c0_g1~~TRINITY_DN33706_c0_g1_i1.p1  ORF type:complete len:1658 (+),score=406.26 TRINITY_DN33706_c0_g1_i1:54-4976(+)
MHPHVPPEVGDVVLCYNRVVGEVLSKATMPQIDKELLVVKRCIDYKKNKKGGVTRIQCVKSCTSVDGKLYDFNYADGNEACNETVRLIANESTRVIHYGSLDTLSGSVFKSILSFLKVSLEVPDVASMEEKCFKYIFGAVIRGFKSKAYALPTCSTASRVSSKADPRHLLDILQGKWSTPTGEVIISGTSPCLGLAHNGGVYKSPGVYLFSVDDVEALWTDGEKWEKMTPLDSDHVPPVVTKLFVTQGKVPLTVLDLTDKSCSDEAGLLEQPAVNTVKLIKTILKGASFTVKGIKGKTLIKVLEGCPVMAGLRLVPHVCRINKRVPQLTITLTDPDNRWNDLMAKVYQEDVTVADVVSADLHPMLYSKTDELGKSLLCNAVSMRAPKVDVVKAIAERTLHVPYSSTGQSVVSLVLSHCKGDVGKQILEHLLTDWEPVKTDPCQILTPDTSGVMLLDVALNSPKEVAMMTCIFSWFTGTFNTTTLDCHSDKLSAMKELLGLDTWSLIAAAPTNSKQEALRDAIDGKETDNIYLTWAHKAMLVGDLELSDKLLKNKEQIEQKDWRGQNMLHFAAQCRKVNGTSLIMKMLKTAPLAVFEVDNTQRTPLHIAGAQGHWKTLECFVSFLQDKADDTRQLLLTDDSVGLSCIDYVASSKCEKLLSVVLNVLAPLQAHTELPLRLLSAALCCSWVEGLRLLIESPMMKCTAEHGGKLLYMLRGKAKEAELKELLEKHGHRNAIVPPELSLPRMKLTTDPLYKEVASWYKEREAKSYNDLAADIVGATAKWGAPQCRNLFHQLAFKHVGLALFVCAVHKSHAVLDAPPPDMQLTQVEGGFDVPYHVFNYSLRKLLVYSLKYSAAGVRAVLAGAQASLTAEDILALVEQAVIYSDTEVLKCVAATHPCTIDRNIVKVLLVHRHEKSQVAADILNTLMDAGCGVSRTALEAAVHHSLPQLYTILRQAYCVSREELMDILPLFPRSSKPCFEVGSALIEDANRHSLQVPNSWWVSGRVSQRHKEQLAVMMRHLGMQVESRAFVHYARDVLTFSEMMKATSHLEKEVCVQYMLRAPCAEITWDCFMRFLDVNSVVRNLRYNEEMVERLVKEGLEGRTDLDLCKALAARGASWATDIICGEKGVIADVFPVALKCKRDACCIRMLAIEALPPGEVIPTIQKAALSNMRPLLSHLLETCDYDPSAADKNFLETVLLTGAPELVPVLMQKGFAFHDTLLEGANSKLEEFLLSRRHGLQAQLKGTFNDMLPYLRLETDGCEILRCVQEDVTSVLLSVGALMAELGDEEGYEMQAMGVRDWTVSALLKAPEKLILTYLTKYYTEEPDDDKKELVQSCITRGYAQAVEEMHKIEGFKEILDDEMRAFCGKVGTVATMCSMLLSAKMQLSRQFVRDNIPSEGKLYRLVVLMMFAGLKVDCVPLSVQAKGSVQQKGKFMLPADYGTVMVLKTVKRVPKTEWDAEDIRHFNIVSGLEGSDVVGWYRETSSRCRAQNPRYSNAACADHIHFNKYDIQGILHREGEGWEDTMVLPPVEYQVPVPVYPGATTIDIFNPDNGEIDFITDLEGDAWGVLPLGVVRDDPVDETKLDLTWYEPKMKYAKAFKLVKRLNKRDGFLEVTFSNWWNALASSGAAFKELLQK